jgi:UDP-N-acetylglucosamine 2-epimerase
MLKVMTVVGTRPELIRLSRVIHRLDETVDHVLVHTGQNYDYSLNEVFFQDLGLREPDHMLGVDTSSLGAVLGGTLIAAERVMLAKRSRMPCSSSATRTRASRPSWRKSPANPGLPHGSRQPMLR